jgi:hypothetical protein
MRIDLPSKVRALGVPVSHVTSTTLEQADGALADGAQLGSGISSSRGVAGVSVR